LTSSRWDIFCSVVDNYGDVGVAWRLARQLAAEHGIGVRLFVDDLRTLGRLASSVASHLEPMTAELAVDGVQIHRWTGATTPAPDRVADVVIDAFGCGVPLAYARAMTERSPSPPWIILEYLSAESWVETHHGLASPHPTLPLQRYFFFPGFTSATGGLLRERDLIARRDAFQSDTAAQAAFRRALGIGEPSPETTVVSLFCYPDAPIAALLDAWADADAPVLCVVPEGVATGALDRWTHGRVPHAGESVARGRLVVAAIPFLSQDDYDRLLWMSDINFVRGEDSFVRAQWAARPLVWNTYAQAGNAHALKLDAFLERYGSGAAPPAAAAHASFTKAWNESGQGTESSGQGTEPSAQGRQSLSTGWRALLGAEPALVETARAWSDTLASRTDLATALVKFVGNRV
jgi:uncharacterized repeat protein (TIGR03837 family)